MPIISPGISGSNLTLQFLNEAAQKLAETCEDERKKEKTKGCVFLHGHEVTNEILKDKDKGILKDKNSNEQELFVYYGSLVNGFLAGSERKIFFDLNDDEVKKYIKNKGFYIIATNGKTIEQIGFKFKACGAKFFIGFNEEFKYHKSYDNVLRESLFNVINDVAIKICSKGVDEKKAVEDVRDYCDSKIKELANYYADEIGEISEIIKHQNFGSLVFYSYIRAQIDVI